MNIKWLCVIAGAALLLGIPTGWPYSYYILLRWLIFIVSLIVAVGFYKSKLTAWVFIFGAIGYIFNPLAPLHMSKSTWISIDFMSAILFFIAAYPKNKK